MQSSLWKGGGELEGILILDGGVKELSGVKEIYQRINPFNNTHEMTDE